MRFLVLFFMLIGVGCSGVDTAVTVEAPETAELFGSAHLVLDGRALKEAACDHALDLLATVPEAMEGYSLAELRGECLEDLIDAPPSDGQRRARCYIDAENVPELLGCDDPDMAVTSSLPQDPPTGMVPHAIADPSGVDPLTWRVCVHLADVAMAELAAQIGLGQEAEIKDMAVSACVDALKDVQRHELETVSDCLLEANNVDEMKGCNLPSE